MSGQAATPELSGSALLRRSFRKSFPPAVHGEGAYLWDAQGKQYLDFSGSAAVNFIGHGVSEIVAAMTAQARALEFVDSSQFTTPVAELYAQQLLNFAGENFCGGAVYFCGDGAEALESASRLAKQYQREIGQAGRWRVLTIGPKESLDSRLRDGESVEEIQQAFAEPKADVAALVIEPGSAAALGSAGNSKNYFAGIARLCRERDVLLIDNEAITGIGRTGRNFAIDHWGVAPDIIVAAKGLSSGYAPLGAVILSKKVVAAVSSGSGSFMHGFTSSSHPISLAAGRAVLKYVLQHNLIDSSNSDCDATIARELKEKLTPLRNLSLVGRVCGVGLLWRVEFPGETSHAAFRGCGNFSSKVAQAAVERGLLVYPIEDGADGDHRDHILIAPPAVISSYQVSWACEQLAGAIEQASAHA